MPRTVADLLALEDPSAEDLRLFVEVHGGRDQAVNLLFDAGLAAQDGGRADEVRRVAGLVDRIERLYPKRR